MLYKITNFITTSSLSPLTAIFFSLCPVHKALAAVIVSLMMYSFMGGGLFCAIVGNILLVVSTATDYWMQYRLSGSFAHQGLWRYCMSGKCYMQTDSIGKWVNILAPLKNVLGLPLVQWYLPEFKSTYLIVTNIAGWMTVIIFEVEKQKLLEETFLG